MKRIIDKPAWWPKCPYPDDIFTMPREEAISHLPTDPNLRTAVAGTLGRIFWEIASDACWEETEKWFDDLMEQIELLKNGNRPCAVSSEKINE